MKSSGIPTPCRKESGNPPDRKNVSMPTEEGEACRRCARPLVRLSDRSANTVAPTLAFVKSSPFTLTCRRMAFVKSASRNVTSSRFAPVKSTRFRDAWVKLQLTKRVRRMEDSLNAAFAAKLFMKTALSAWAPFAYKFASNASVMMQYISCASHKLAPLKLAPRRSAPLKSMPAKSRPSRSAPRRSGVAFVARLHSFQAATPESSIDRCSGLPMRESVRRSARGRRRVRSGAPSRLRCPRDRTDVRP